MKALPCSILLSKLADHSKPCYIALGVRWVETIARKITLIIVYFCNLLVLPIAIVFLSEKKA